MPRWTGRDGDPRRPGEQGRDQDGRRAVPPLQARASVAGRLVRGGAAPHRSFLYFRGIKTGAHCSPLPAPAPQARCGAAALRASLRCPSRPTPIPSASASLSRAGRAAPKAERRGNVRDGVLPEGWAQVRHPACLAVLHVPLALVALAPRVPRTTLPARRPPAARPLPACCLRPLRPLCCFPSLQRTPASARSRLLAPPGRAAARAVAPRAPADRRPTPTRGGQEGVGKDECEGLSGADVLCPAPCPWARQRGRSDPP